MEERLLTGIDSWFTPKWSSNKKWDYLISWKLDMMTSFYDSLFVLNINIKTIV